VYSSGVAVPVLVLVRIQLVVAAGLDVATTASGITSRYCKSLGAKYVFDHAKESVVEDITAALDGVDFSGGILRHHGMFFSSFIYGILGAELLRTCLESQSAPLFLKKINRNEH